MKRYVTLTSEADRAAIVAWWRQMNPPPGSHAPSYAGRRAELRRAIDPAAVLVTEGFADLAARLSDDQTEPEKLLPLAAAAGIVAHVGENDPSLSFAAQLAKPAAESGDKPRLSALRFAQLQQSHDLDLFYRRTIRAVKLLRGTANVLSIVDGVLQWAQEELSKHYQSDPRDRLRVRWGLDYFRKPSNRDQSEQAEQEEETP